MEAITIDNDLVWVCLCLKCVSLYQKMIAR